MTAQSPLITRRTLLAALTTGIAAAPFASPQRRARAADGAAPRRLVIYWSPNGTVHKNYWPTDPTDLTSSAILSPLAAFQDRMIVSSAVAKMAAIWLRMKADTTRPRAVETTT